MSTSANGKVQPLDLDVFVAALNENHESAVKALRAQAQSLRFSELNYLLLPVVIVFLSVLLFVTQDMPVEVFPLALANLVLATIFSSFWAFWCYAFLDIFLIGNAKREAAHWSTPLAGSHRCRDFEDLLDAHEKLPLLPQGGEPRPLYIADFLRAEKLVRAAERAAPAVAEKKACARLHSRAFTKNAEREEGTA